MGCNGCTRVRRPVPPGETTKKDPYCQRFRPVATLCGGAVRSDATVSRSLEERRSQVAGNSTETGRSVTSKVIAILLTFTDGSVHSLTEIARLAGLPISTAHRLAAELTARGVLDRTEDGDYRVGLPLRMIGTRAPHPPNIQERAPRVMEDLCTATRTSERPGVSDDLEIAYIEKAPGHRPVTMFSAAATLPAHATALGKALLAFTSPRIVDLVIAEGLRAYT